MKIMKTLTLICGGRGGWGSTKSWPMGFVTLKTKKIMVLKNNIKKKWDKNIENFDPNYGGTGGSGVNKIDQ